MGESNHAPHATGTTQIAMRRQSISVLRSSMACQTNHDKARNHARVCTAMNALISRLYRSSRNIIYAT